MRYLQVVLFGLLGCLCTAPASAQISIGNTPIQIVGAIDIKLTPLGDVVTLNTKLLAGIKNAENVFNTFIPQINDAAGCRKTRAHYAPVLTKISLGPKYLVQSRPVEVTADFDLSDCYGGFALSGSGRASFSIIAVAQKNKVRLQVSDLTITSSGLYLVGVRLSDNRIQKAKDGLQKQLHAKIKSIEAMMNTILARTAALKKIKISVHNVGAIVLSARGGDLTVQVDVSGQVPARAVDQMLARL
jgi:hypothetical protein